MLNLLIINQLMCIPLTANNHIFEYLSDNVNGSHIGNGNGNGNDNHTIIRSIPLPIPLINQKYAC
jgi:hypothetical protein